MKLTVNERKYVTEYFKTRKTFFTIQIDLSIIIYAKVKDTYTKDVHGKISDSASEGQIISAFLNKSIDI